MKNRTYIWAIILIALGGLLLMRNLDLLFFEIPKNLISWRLIPLGIGINALINKNYLSAIIAIGIAIIFYIPDYLNPAQLSYYYKLWPMLLILAGVYGLLKYLYPAQLNALEQQNHDSNQNVLNDNYFMSGASKKIFANNFSGGKFTCVMGGAELDFTESQLLNNGHLEVFIMMGGLELRLPKEWNVKLNVMPIAGGVEDKIKRMPENVVIPEKVLTISGYVIMGGIEIKRF